MSEAFWEMQQRRAGMTSERGLSEYMQLEFPGESGAMLLRVAEVERARDRTPRRDGAARVSGIRVLGWFRRNRAKQTVGDNVHNRPSPDGGDL
jgi:hypothetical protein